MLPLDTYYLLDYIQTTGANQYIILDINPTQIDENFTRILNTSWGAYGDLFGAGQNTENGGDKGCLVRLSSSDGAVVCVDRNWSPNYRSISLNVIYDVHAILKSGEQKLYLNDQLVSSNNATGSITTTNPLYFFNCNFGNGLNQWADHSIYGKVWYSRFYKNGDLVCNLVPAMRKSDSIVGFYDTVSSRFYTRAGGGNFAYGHILDVIPSPQDKGYAVANYDSVQAIPITNAYKLKNWVLNNYTRLDYIQSTGTQYIDSLYDNKAGFIAEYELSYNEFSGDQGHLGSIAVSGSTYWRSYMQYYSPTNSEQFGFFSYFPSIDTPTSNIKYKYKLSTISGDGYLYINDILKAQSAITFADSASINAYIFAVNYNGANALCKAKMYYLKLWDKNNNLVRDYIPVIRHSDGAIGMLDLVHLKFYGNSGTGEFIGGDVYAS